MSLQLPTFSILKSLRLSNLIEEKNNSQLAILQDSAAKRSMLRHQTFTGEAALNQDQSFNEVNLASLNAEYNAIRNSVFSDNGLNYLA